MNGKSTCKSALVVMIGHERERRATDQLNGRLHDTLDVKASEEAESSKTSRNHDLFAPAAPLVRGKTKGIPISDVCEYACVDRDCRGD